MKKLFSTLLLATAFTNVVGAADEQRISSPDGNLQVMVTVDGAASYKVLYKGKTFLESSPLGLITNVSDFSKGLKMVNVRDTVANDDYTLRNAKASHISYSAKGKIFSIENEKKQPLEILFLVSNNDVAFRYRLLKKGDRACCTVERELTGFNFPQGTTTFLCPQAKPEEGWMRTKPSYEEEYVADEPMGTPTKRGLGYTFPCLFHEGGNNWILVSETGVDGYYCGSRLSDGTADGLYSIAYPEKGEFGGIGDANPSIALPGLTPWRTITVGDNLRPIVETTIPFDVVKPRYEASEEYKFGRSTWSWIVWQDPSINYDDQVRYINLASAMGYEYCLVDGGWMKNIGRDRIKELADYARSKNVALFLWYNSNGYWNDAPQDPKGCMDNIVARKHEMAWMKSLGVKGIKVDFFGSDKQQTMQLYEEILSDANDYGLMVIFHGCTIPRGWERMYPNYASSEAVLASENHIFGQHAEDVSAFNASLHPFIRNAVGGMEFGGTFLNKRLNRGNNGGVTRRTGDIFEVATAVLYQSPVQNFALTPNNFGDVDKAVEHLSGEVIPIYDQEPDNTDKAALNLMKNMPTTWDETRFIDGYPGKYVVLARRHNSNWYIVGVNAEKATKKLTLKIPDLWDGKHPIFEYYADTEKGGVTRDEKTLSKKNTVNVEMPSNGGFLLTQMVLEKIMIVEDTDVKDLEPNP